MRGHNCGLAGEYIPMHGRFKGELVVQEHLNFVAFFRFNEGPWCLIVDSKDRSAMSIPNIPFVCDRQIIPPRLSCQANAGEQRQDCTLRKSCHDCLPGPERSKGNRSKDCPTLLFTVPNLSSFTAFFPGRTSVVQVSLQPSDATVRVYRVRGANPLSRNLTQRKTCSTCFRMVGVYGV